MTRRGERRSRFPITLLISPIIHVTLPAVLLDIFKTTSHKRIYSQMPKALGGLLARALPQARHAVYAGMYMHDCNTKSCEKDAFNFTEE